MVYVRLEMGLEVLKREQKGKINNLPLIYRLLSLIWKATFASVYIFLPLLLNMQDCQFCLLSQPVIPNSAKHWHRFGHGSDLVNPFALGNCNLTALLHCCIVYKPASFFSDPPTPTPSPIWHLRPFWPEKWKNYAPYL